MSRVCMCCGKIIKSNGESNWHKSCSLDFFSSPTPPLLDFSQKEIEEYAFSELDNKISVPGAQKKISLGLSNHSHNKKVTLVDYPKGYILKFSPTPDSFFCEYEQLGMLMLEKAKLPVVKHGLVRLKDGQIAYITKRIDREITSSGVKKFPMEDFCQIEGKLTEYKYNGSYEKIGKLINKYSISPELDRITFFKSIFLFYLIGNTDMHLKNFSLIDQGNGYRLAPFYDVLPVMMLVNQNEMALTINGKQKKITKNDFFKFGKTIGIEDWLASRLMDSVVETIKNSGPLIDSSFIPEEEKTKFKSFLNKRISIFL